MAALTAAAKKRAAFNRARYQQQRKLFQCAKGEIKNAQDLAILQE